jgi:hypothetical protein
MIITIGAIITGIYLTAISYFKTKLDDDYEEWDSETCTP